MELAMFLPPGVAFWANSYCRVAVLIRRVSVACKLKGYVVCFHMLWYFEHGFWSCNREFGVDSVC